MKLYIIFTLYHIICVSYNMTFAFKYLIPQNLNQHNNKITNVSINNKNKLY